MENGIDSFVKEHGLNERKVTDVSSGICPCGPSKKVRAAIRKAVRDIRFPAGPALARLRNTLASKLGVDGDCLVFSNSVEELLRLVSSVFDPKKILSAGPLLDVHSAALSASGAKVEHAAYGENGSLKEMGPITPESANASLIFISQPNRITGCLSETEWMRKTLDSFGPDKAIAVVDESLIEFTDDPGSCGRAARGEGVIVLRSTVNFYGLPGLGLAYAVSSPDIITKLERAKNCEVNILAAVAARAAVRDGTYRRTARKYIADEKKFLLEALEKIRGLTCCDSDSNVLLLRAACPVDKMSVILARKGFLMADWRTAEEPGETFFRVSVMGHEKNVKFVRILKQAFAVTD